MIQPYVSSQTEPTFRVPNYGDNPPPGDVSVPEWILGGDRKRRVLRELADADPPEREVAPLIDQLKVGRATVYEVLRSLERIGAVERPERGVYRLNREDGVGKALGDLMEALTPFEGIDVDRPPHRKRG